LSIGETRADFSLTSEEAVRLTRSVQEGLAHDIYFAQSLMTASLEDIETLRRLIRNSNKLMSNRMDDFQKQVHRGVKLTERAIRARDNRDVNPSSRFRKLIRVAR
jgi:hypothetical protein